MLELDFCLFIQQTLREHLQRPDLYNGMHKTDKAEKNKSSLCSQEASRLVGETDNRMMRKARTVCDEKEGVMCSEWGQAGADKKGCSEVSVSDPVALSAHSQYSPTLLTFYQRSIRLLHCCDTISDTWGKRFILVHNFGCFHSWLDGLLYCFGPVVKQILHEERARGKTIHSTLAGKPDRAAGREQGPFMCPLPTTTHAP